MEALFGFLHLTHQEERIDTLFRLAYLDPTADTEA